MSIVVDILPALNVVAIHVDGDTVFVRRDQCTEFLAKFMRAMADSIPEPRKDEMVADVLAFPDPGQHSVKVPGVDDDYLGPDDIELYGAGSQ